MDEVTRILSGCRLGVHLSAEELRVIAQAGRVRQVGDLERLAGLDEIAVLLEGEAEVRYSAPGGPAWTTRAGPGDVLNEEGFLGCTAALLLIRARGAARVFLLGRSAFRGLVDRGEPAAARLALSIASAVAARLDDRSAALLELLRRHEALMETMDRILANRAHATAPAAGGESFAAFKRRLLDHWGD